MNKTNTNSNLFKRMPLRILPVSNEIGKKLYGGSKREEELKLTDWRTPFFAAKGDGKAKNIANSKISGVSGVRPTERAAIVEQVYRIVYPHISHNEDYVKGEEKYLPYRFSSRSIKLPYSSIKDKTIYDYFKNAQNTVDPKVKDALLQAVGIGEKSISELIPAKSLRLKSFEEAAEGLPGTTNWGLPYMISGTEVSQGKIVKDNRPLYIEIAKKLAYNTVTETDILKNAFISIGRGQESNDQKDRIEGEVIPKQRRPWAEGHAGTIIGARMKPYLDLRAKDSRRYALVNQSKVDEVIHQAFKNLSGKDWMLAGDGSTYDTWMLKDVAMEIAKVIISRFNTSEADNAACFKYFEHMFEDPLVTPEGILGGRHGMPSGTTFTNELDSAYNEVLSIAFGLLPHNFNPLSLKLEMVTDQGDDAVMIIRVNDDTDLDTETIADHISKGYSAMNMSVNPKKQMISRHKTEFLKRLHLAERVESYRSYVGTTIGMCNLEHAKAGKYPMYSARYIMQAANHYANLPGFNEFMEFVERGDEELHLGVGIKGGAYTIFQRAGGVNTVLKRLDYTSYATHLGVTVDKQEAKLAQSLSSAEGIRNRNQTSQG